MSTMTDAAAKAEAAKRHATTERMRDLLGIS